MCRCGDTLSQEGRTALASVLADICKALDPEHPESVVIGPVDFGPEPSRGGEPEPTPTSQPTTVSRDGVTGAIGADRSRCVGPHSAVGKHE